MKDKDKNRDQGLEKILEVFRKEDPEAEDINLWSKAVSDELAIKPIKIKRSMPRFMEWAIAASVGFFIALALDKISDSDIDFENDGKEYTSAEYSGVDATEMRLIAIHE